ncbi:MAG: VWA-like domain-containing protein [Thermoguttaceae bacterium]|nr:VWA-like domain-containing protein [Thermoguttaceae bacterium]
MFSHTIEYYETEEQKNRLISALNCVCVIRPYLSGLATRLKIYVSDSLATAGITASGRLLVNPKFLDLLKIQELAFIIAHELMHLVLHTHERQGNFPDHQLVNIAHDFIINDDLISDFGFPPAGGLNWVNCKYQIDSWKPAKEYSLEELVSVLKDKNRIPQQSWCSPEVLSKQQDSPLNDQQSRGKNSQTSNGGGTLLGQLLEEVGITISEDEKESLQKDSEQENPSKPFVQNPWDVLSADEEKLLFPDLPQETQAAEQKEIREAVVRAYSEAALSNTLKNFGKKSSKGTETGAGYDMVEMLRASYSTPWEAALQRWFDSVTPGDRSFAKASRRGAWRTDVVLPGRKREGWTLHIVLDTSGSMTNSLRYALGAIDHFCQNNNVETIHILQCDAEVTQDDWIEVGNLENYQVKGFGGSDMSPAMLRLADDPDVTAVIVLTDGYIDYPEEEPPYVTLWGIVDNGNTDFPYGTAIRIEPDEN